MYFVSFETSTKIFSIAVNQDERVLRFRNLKSALVLEDNILPALDRILIAAGLKFDQLDGFAIALGPGSFTSLRVGLSTVKSFAMATGKPVVGIPSMDIIAHGLSFRRKTESFYHYDEICVLNDARREKVYACLYGPEGKTGEYLLTSIDDVLDRVHGRTLFVGDALKVHQKRITEAYKKYASGKKTTCQCLFADEEYWYPQARVMAVLAYERFRQKRYDDAAKLLPLYLYPQDCQVSVTHGS